jgi:tetratricopeptide (TPR) repeat protein
VADAYAWALYANGRFEDADRLSDRALALGTRNVAFLFHAAMIERQLGRDAVALRLMSRALRLNPRFSVLHAATAERVRSELEAST